LLHECIDLKILLAKLINFCLGHTAQAQNSVIPEVYLPKEKHKRGKNNIRVRLETSIPFTVDLL
jgi:hypothetical protein